MRVGVEGPPLTCSEIAEIVGAYNYSISSAVEHARKKILKACFTRKKFVPAREGWMVTPKIAEKIIGGPVGVILKDPVDGLCRVSCHDAYGAVLCTSGRNLPQALRRLIEVNYKRSCQFVVERDGYRCTNCGGFKNLQRDHINPRAQGRCDRPENLTTLCEPCHILRHSRKGFHKGIHRVLNQKVMRMIGGLL